MDIYTLLTLTCVLVVTTAWTVPYYPVQKAPLRITRFAPPPQRHRIPIKSAPASAESDNAHYQRPKRDHHDDYDHEHGHGHRGTSGVTGPVHTFVKTDKNANYKWGVRHHVGKKYAS